MSEVMSIGRPWDLAWHRLSRRLRLPSGGGVWRSGRALRDYDLQALARVRALLPQCALATREYLRAPLATMASPGAPDIPALSHPVHTTTY